MGGAVLMAVDAALVDRAGELKRELVAFSRQPRYDRAFREVLARHGDGSEVLDEHRLMMLWDYFVLEHRLRNGRTIVEQFVDAHAELSRLVPLGEEWMLSGPTSVLRPAERDVAYRLALEMSLRTPEAVYRNPEKLAKAWEIQRADRQRFIGFFGADLVVVPGDQAQERLNKFHKFCRDEVLRTSRGAARRGGGAAAPVVELPPDLVESETVALIYDEEDGLGFYAEFGLVEAAFADPDLVRRRRYREHVLSYLHDDRVEPMVLRRLAERDPDKASVLFRRLLRRPRFDWARNGEELLRTAKAAYFARVPRPRVSPVSERLAAYAGRR